GGGGGGGGARARRPGERRRGRRHAPPPGPVRGLSLPGPGGGGLGGTGGGVGFGAPPLEYDPATGEPLEPELVEVGPCGTVRSWTWVVHPTPKHPFDHPFAFALIQLDGADTAITHAVDAGAIDAMATGMRVMAQFRDERAGATPDCSSGPEAAARAQATVPADEPVTITEHLVSLTISEPLYPHRARFARGLLDGRIVGQRSPVSGKVYVPSNGY